jgi:hypothetical protein
MSGHDALALAPMGTAALKGTLAVREPGPWHELPQARDRGDGLLIVDPVGRLPEGDELGALETLVRLRGSPRDLILRPNEVVQRVSFLPWGAGSLQLDWVGAPWGVRLTHRELYWGSKARASIVIVVTDGHYSVHQTHRRFRLNQERQIWLAEG